MEHDLQRARYTDNKVHDNNTDSTCKCLKICSAGTEDISSREAFFKLEAVRTGCITPVTSSQSLTSISIHAGSISRLNSEVDGSD